jgi:hypothetical protein
MAQPQITDSVDTTTVVLPPISDLVLTTGVDRNPAITDRPPTPARAVVSSTSGPYQVLVKAKPGGVPLPSIGEALRQLQPAVPQQEAGNDHEEEYANGLRKLTYQGLRILTYNIGGNFYAMTQPMNETNAWCERRTRGKRLLRYHLHVLQPPKRARACGAGTKCKFIVEK